MNTEDRLRTALHAMADDTEVDPGSYDRIERRTAQARRRRRAVGGGLAAVALVAVAVGVPLALRDGDGESVRVGPASDSREPTPTTSTTTEPDEEPAPAPAPTDDPAFMWPADGRRFGDAHALVEAFATEYLGVVDPAVEDNGDSTFTVRPRGEGGGPVPAQGPRTVVEVATVEGDPVVINASSANIVISTPTRGAALSSPVTVSGQARNLFEGNVIVEVRDQRGAVLATTNTTAAGSGPELAAFSVDVTFTATGRGAVVVKSDSGIEGTPEATLVPVVFGAGEPTTEVTVYLVDERGDFVPVTREVPRTTGVLRAALLELLEGAIPEEEARGLTSPFDDDAGLLRGVTITPDGTAVVDLDPAFADALADANGAAVLASLDHTVFQFPSVVWVTYRLGGECGTFAGIGTDLLCERRTRDQY